MSSSKPRILSHRLTQLIQLIQEGSGEVLWDIGCDHGLLGLSAPGLRPRLKEVHFVDPSDPVITVLENTIDAHIPKPLFKITLHKQAGEELTIPATDNVFIIAGMGGMSILRILAHLRQQSRESDQFVIAPNRDIWTVRAALHEAGWGLRGERLVEEGGQFFQLLALAPIKTVRAVSLYGEDFWQSVVGERYKSHLLDKMSVHRDAASLALLQWLRR